MAPRAAPHLFLTFSVCVQAYLPAIAGLPGGEGHAGGETGASQLASLTCDQLRVLPDLSVALGGACCSPCSSACLPGWLAVCLYGCRLAGQQQQGAAESVGGQPQRRAGRGVAALHALSGEASQPHHIILASRSRGSHGQRGKRCDMRHCVTAGTHPARQLAACPQPAAALPPSSPLALPGCRAQNTPASAWMPSEAPACCCLPPWTAAAQSGSPHPLWRWTHCWWVGGCVGAWVRGCVGGSVSPGSAPATAAQPSGRQLGRRVAGGAAGRTTSHPSQSPGALMLLPPMHTRCCAGAQGPLSHAAQRIQQDCGAELPGRHLAAWLWWPAGR